ISSRTFLQKILSDTVLVNGKEIKQSYKLRVGDEVEVNIEKLERILNDIDRNKDIQGEMKELNIIAENKEYLVINKPKDMVVHPGKGNSQHTLVNYIKGYLTKTGDLNKDVTRVGLVHRLDKGVSGLIIFGKTPEFQKHLQKQFENHKVDKLYLADVYNIGKLKKYNLNITKEIDKLIKSDMKIDNTWYCADGYIGRNPKERIKMKFDTREFNNSKKALSYVKAINDKQILIKIETGRMHQIRATLEFLGISIIGDTLYSKEEKDGIPKSIGLESILLSFRNISGKRITFRLY
ncbi:MAG: RluA family pseudouridine synthase, partial [Candidatus Dojkabacteria bacterium]|nr:RluA family pseudouridine synthase [Candidatus Dojkabacteria bacterium]